MRLINNLFKPLLLLLPFSSATLGGYLPEWSEEPLPDYHGYIFVPEQNPYLTPGQVQQLRALQDLDVSTANIPAKYEPEADERPSALLNFTLGPIHVGSWNGRVASQFGKVGKDLRILRTKAEDDPELTRYPKIYLGAEFEGLYAYTINRAHALNPTLPKSSTSGVSVEKSAIYLIGNLLPAVAVEYNYRFDKDEAETAMLVVGDLQRSPLYASVGLQYAQFGRFSGFSAYTDPLTKELFRINTFNAIAGFYRKTFEIQASILADKGNTNINAMAINAAYRFASETVGVEISASVISNILNKTSTFQDPLFTDNIKRLPAVDVYVDLLFQRDFNLRFEYAQVTRSTPAFGALGAYAIEARYLLPIDTLPVYATAGYSQIINGEKVFTHPCFTKTRRPENQVVTSMIFEVLTNTQLGVEYVYGNSFYDKSYHLLQASLTIKL